MFWWSNAHPTHIAILEMHQMMQTGAGGDSDDTGIWVMDINVAFLKIICTNGSIGGKC